jgi:hypothetical protein
MTIGLDALQFLLRTAIRDMKNSTTDLENLFDLSKTNTGMYIYHFQQVEMRAKYVREMIEQYSESK